MTSASGSDPAFEWKQEYDSILERISVTDDVKTEWSLLRDIIKFKIKDNIRRYLSGELKDASDDMDVDKTPEFNARSSPTFLPSSSPFRLGPSPVHTGFPAKVLPPPPKREFRKNFSGRFFSNTMDEKVATDFKIQIFEQLDDFEGEPPFTIQRLCELCVSPRKHYKTVGKYLRALERTVLVTSTKDMYPPEDPGNISTGSADDISSRLSLTPVFTPIPFLHDDARRSRSPSPFELAAITATKRPEFLFAGRTSAQPDKGDRLRRTKGLGLVDELDDPKPGRLEGDRLRRTKGLGLVDELDDPKPGRLEGDRLRRTKGLGLVDELDDPKPGHLADRPTPLTAVTTPTPTLKERFVKSSSPELDDSATQDSTADNANSKQAEDAEVEGMVLANNVAEDEDKENKTS